MYIKRHAEAAVARLSKMFGAVLVAGPRQVGKTTMLERMIGGVGRVTLDDPIMRAAAEQSSGTFFKDNPPPVFVDEVQKAPGLFEQIKLILDRDKKKGQFYLSGSQQFRMMKGVSESLAGRIGPVTLLGLSLRERAGVSFDEQFLPTDGYLAARAKEKTEIAYGDVWNIIHRGSMPELVCNPDYEWGLFYGAYVNTYIERDVIQTGIRNLKDYRKFLTILASRIGQEFQLNAVAAEVGVAVQTAKQWLSVAESSGLVYLLPPFFENVGKTVIKRPKLFFTDTGFAAWLCNIPSAEALSRAYNSGSFFENFVIIELLKSWIHNGEQPHFYFYRDTRFNEIDLLIFDGVEYHPVEIKTTESPQAGMVKAFDNIKGSHVKRGSGALICLTKEPRYLTSDVIAHSIWDI